MISQRSPLPSAKQARRSRSGTPPGDGSDSVVALSPHSPSKSRSPAKRKRALGAAAAAAAAAATASEDTFVIKRPRTVVSTVAPASSSGQEDISAALLLPETLVAAFHVPSLTHASLDTLLRLSVAEGRLRVEHCGLCLPVRATFCAHAQRALSAVLETPALFQVVTEALLSLATTDPATATANIVAAASRRAAAGLDSPSPVRKRLLLGASFQQHHRDAASSSSPLADRQPHGSASPSPARQQNQQQRQQQRSPSGSPRSTSSQSPRRRAVVATASPGGVVCASGLVGLLTEAKQTPPPQPVTRFVDASGALCAMFCDRSTVVLTTTVASEDGSALHCHCTQCGPTCCAHVVRTVASSSDATVSVPNLAARLSMLSDASLVNMALNLLWNASCLDTPGLTHALVHIAQLAPAAAAAADQLPVPLPIPAILALTQGTIGEKDLSAAKVAVVGQALVGEVGGVATKYCFKSKESFCSKCGPASRSEPSLWCNHVASTHLQYSRSCEQGSSIVYDIARNALSAAPKETLVQIAVRIAQLTGTCSDLDAVLQQLTAGDSAPEIHMDLVRVVETCCPATARIQPPTSGWLLKFAKQRVATLGDAVASAERDFLSDLQRATASLTEQQCSCQCMCDIDMDEPCLDGCFDNCQCAAQFVKKRDNSELRNRVVTDLGKWLDKIKMLINERMVSVASPLLLSLSQAVDPQLLPEIHLGVVSLWMMMFRSSSLVPEQCVTLVSQLEPVYSQHPEGAAAMLVAGWVAALNQAPQGVLLDACNQMCQASASTPLSPHRAAAVCVLLNEAKMPAECATLCWVVLRVVLPVVGDNPHLVPLFLSVAHCLAELAPEDVSLEVPDADRLRNVHALLQSTAGLTFPTLFAAVVADVSRNCALPSVVHVLGSLLLSSGHRTVGTECLYRAAAEYQRRRDPINSMACLTTVVASLGRRSSSPSPSKDHRAATPDADEEGRFCQRVVDMFLIRHDWAFLQVVLASLQPMAGPLALVLLAKLAPALIKSHASLPVAFWSLFLQRAIDTRATLDSFVLLAHTTFQPTQPIALISGLLQTGRLADAVALLGRLIVHPPPNQKPVQLAINLFSIPNLPAELKDVVATNAPVLLKEASGMDKLRVGSLLLADKPEFAGSLAAACLKHEAEDPALRVYAANLLASAVGRMSGALRDQHIAFMAEHLDMHELWTVSSVFSQLGQFPAALEFAQLLTSRLAQQPAAAAATAQKSPASSPAAASSAPVATGSAIVDLLVDLLSKCAPGVTDVASTFPWLKDNLSTAELASLIARVAVQPTPSPNAKANKPAASAARTTTPPPATTQANNLLQSPLKRSPAQGRLRTAKH